MRRILLLTVVIALPAQAQAQGACADVDCGAGVCFAERGTPGCLCDDGFAAVGLECARSEHDDELVLRARRRPGAAERAVAIAEAQLDRKRAQIEHGGDALSDYLAPDEWWCSDFVAWVYQQAGVPFSGGAMGGWLLTNNHAMERWFATRGMWVDRRSDAMDEYVPQPGDFVRFPTERGGHAAIVVRANGTTLHTIEGNVSGEVARGRYFHYRDNPLIAGFGRVALDNAPPEVDAGEALDVLVGDTITLAGHVQDDGPAEALRVAWTADVPGVAWTGADRAEAEARFDRPGRFELTLEADDGEHVVQRSVRVTARRDDPPALTLRERERGPLWTRLSAEVVDEGTPALRWEVRDGPGDVELSDPAAADTEAHFSAPGRYVLALAADDGVNLAEQRLTVHVQAASFGCAATPGRGSAPWLLALLLAWKLRRRRP